MAIAQAERWIIRQIVRLDMPRLRFYYDRGLSNWPFVSINNILWEILKVSVVQYDAFFGFKKLAG